MKLDSLIDNIRDSIVTGLGKKVRVSDKSLLNVLISDIGSDESDKAPEDDNSGNSISRIWKGVRAYITPRWNLRFPMSRLALQALLLLALLPLLVIYSIVALLNLLLGKKCSLWSVMHSPRINMLISLSIMVGVITILVSMFVFFINDVMLYSPERDINSKGALTITQPCHREHSIFMFNSATLWADTGIDLVEGDIVTISGSGSFDSSIWDKTDNAQKNFKPRYSLVNIAYDDRSENQFSYSDIQFCIFNDTTDRDNLPRFGSLLFQIQPTRRKCVNMNSDTLRPICQAHLNPSSGVLNEQFKVRKSGTLFVAVNDIYLSTDIVESMFVCDSDSVWHVAPGAESSLELYLTPSQPTDSMLNNEISLLHHKLLSLASSPEGRGHWLNDNCGDILLSIRVERNIWSETTLGPVDKIYSYVFRGLENIMFPDQHTLRALIILGLCIVAWLILDFGIGKVMRRHFKKIKT